MKPGHLARRLLGERGFVRAAESYRAIFVSLDSVVDCLPTFPPAAEILDVGGGDGALLDRILARFPDARATMVDLVPRIGVAIARERRGRVRLLPATRLADYRASGATAPDVVLLADVLHHVPPAEREPLLREIRAVGGAKPLRLVVKDVAPGGFRAWLSVFADRWISGDRNVELLTPAAAMQLVASVFPEWTASATPLLDRDPPNYCLVFTPPAA
jgi:hypothetical protein